MSQQAGSPGAYDQEAERLLVEMRAKAVVVIVLEGKRGFGMSVSCSPNAAAQMHVALPALLRAVADGIDGGAGPDGVRVTVS